MIFDKNFFKMTGEDGFFIYQEQEKTGFVNPYNDNPYMISSLKKLKKRIACSKKQSIINECLDNYNDDAVDKPQLNMVFENDTKTTTSGLADYARASYQKVMKDLEQLQNLIEKFSINEVRI